MIEDRDYIAHDAVGLAELVRAGQVTPKELVEAAIRRIEAYDGTLNAVIHPLFEKALAAADSPDLPDGPFRGVPMVLKDLWPASAGDPIHLGMAVLRDAGYRHPADGTQVASLRRAGFNFVGRTNVPELGLSVTTEPRAYGPTLNPWSAAHSPGGSSGGSAAAVAAGLVPVAGATDAGGSIRMPAAHCGLLGLKPSRGRVPMGAHDGESNLTVLHALTRTVRDSAAILDVEAVPLPGDLWVTAGRVRCAFGEAIKVPPPPLRIAMWDATFFESPLALHPDCAAGLRRAAGLLEQLGHTLEAGRPEPLNDIGVISVLGRLWEATVAAALEDVRKIVGRTLTAEHVEPMTWRHAGKGHRLRATDLLRAFACQERFRREMASWWADGGFDLYLTSTTAYPAPELGSMVAVAGRVRQTVIRGAAHGAFTMATNLGDAPAISIPIGRNDDGLPVGVQLAAAGGREDLLLQVAAQLEAVNPWPQISPHYPALD